MGRRVAIVGFGQTEMMARSPMIKTELANQGVRRALNDAELTMKDIDEVIIPDIEAFHGVHESEMGLADFVGHYMKPVTKFETGGTVSGSACLSAVHHVSAGASDVVLVSGTSKFTAAPPTKYSRGTFLQAMLSSGFHPVWEKWIAGGAIGIFALAASAYIAFSGCTEEAVAKCRVIAAKNANKNPHAHLRDLVTIEDVLKSPMLMWPVRALHTCPITEGSAALIFASEEKARKITNKPVWVKDVVTIHAAQYWAAIESFLAPKERVGLPSLVKACEVIYKRNGITNPAKELDVVEMYDPFTWAQLIWMESMRLCETNEAWKIVERGDTEITGKIPVNPSGGVTCTNPGIPSAMIRYGEVALQIRGDAGEHQIPKEVKLGLGTGFGGTGWTPLMLLSKEK